MPTTSATPDGVLPVDKPAGMTSHDVVALARRSLGVRRIGHTGTLDPFATGLLVLLVGQATRLARFVQDEPKIYNATITFGAETTTDDTTGAITRTADLPSPDDVDSAIRVLSGRIQQIPPDYSAKQIGGRRAYAAARARSPLVLSPVEVTIHQWRVRARSASTLDVTVSCSGGTYIRALARDLGRATNSAAHLTALRRLRSGVFDLADAVSIDNLRAGEALPKPMRAAISHLPAQLVGEQEIRRVRHGQPIDSRIDASLVALVDAGGDLVALGRRDGELVWPNVVMHS